MKIVFTKHSKEPPTDKVRCRSCNKVISQTINGVRTPSFEECYKNGNIPVPNFGWLCSQECAEKFEKETGITFGRTVDGKIDDYNGSLE